MYGLCDFAKKIFLAKQACFFAQHGCISDASAALDLLRGQAGGASGDAGADADLLRQQRAKALSRRGAALAQLGLAREALGEFEAALEEQPGIFRSHNFQINVSTIFSWPVF